MITFLFTILFPVFSYAQEDNETTYMELVNDRLHIMIVNRSQIDTSTSLAGELRVYKKIGFIKVRIAKGVNRHEYVYSNDYMIYYKDIMEYYKNKNLISLICYYYFVDNEFVKFEEIMYKRESAKDSSVIFKRNVLYLDNGKIVGEELDKSHPSKLSRKELKVLLENVSYQIDQFKLIRNYDLENKMPSS